MDRFTCRLTVGRELIKVNAVTLRALVVSEIDVSFSPPLFFVSSLMKGHRGLLEVLQGRPDTCETDDKKRGL